MQLASLGETRINLPTGTDEPLRRRRRIGPSPRVLRVDAMAEAGGAAPFVEPERRSSESTSRGADAVFTHEFSGRAIKKRW